MALVLYVLSLVATPLDLAATTPPAAVPCRSVADCWLSDDGKAIARPRSKRGRRIPRGDCGRNLLWLRHILSCEENVCVSKRVGDKC